VSRKEIFIANAMFLYPLAAIISTLQIIGIHIDGFIRWLVSSEWRGLELDFQILQAPDMKNIGVFFIVTFSILLVVGSISYLVGSLIARWKNQTIIAATILALLSLALIGSTDLMARIIDIFTFMFTDDTTGLMIVLKQIILSTLVMAIAFPIMRKIPAARQ
jgi:hypothetical protein